jgi:hypothetical protein
LHSGPRRIQRKNPLVRHVGGAAFDHGAEEHILRAEVVGDERNAGPDHLGHVSHGCPVKTMDRKQFLGRIQYSFTGSLAIAACVRARDARLTRRGGLGLRGLGLERPWERFHGHAANGGGGRISSTVCSSVQSGFESTFGSSAGYEARNLIVFHQEAFPIVEDVERRKDAVVAPLLIFHQPTSVQLSTSK